jgi:nucleoside-diphosphate-sugar epimerase
MEELVVPMRVLITGNLGYVGPVLVAHLRSRFPDTTLIGYDTAYFAHTLAGTLQTLLDRQVFGDVRDLPSDLLEGIDAVVHLAAISNDPMGSRFEAVTDEINFGASVALAEAAHRAGARHFVFASSCGVYGATNGLARRETDDVAPLTAYARSKVNAERLLERTNLRPMTVTCLRFATACGMSPGLRLDLVLNDFVASALVSREITVLSDGTPWRPLIDVADMARAIEWAIVRKPDNGGPFLTINVGADQANYRMNELAEAVAAAVPDTSVSINRDAPPDKRSYRVDFSLFRELAPDFAPQMTLAQSIASLREGLLSAGFREGEFRNSQHMRLKALEDHVAAGRLAPDLHWCGSLGESVRAVP